MPQLAIGEWTRIVIPVFSYENPCQPFTQSKLGMSQNIVGALRVCLRLSILVLLLLLFLLPMIFCITVAAMPIGARDIKATTLNLVAVGVVLHSVVTGLLLRNLI